MRSPPQQKIGLVGKTLAQGDDDWNEPKGDQSDWKQQHWKAHDNRSTETSERVVRAAGKEAPKRRRFLKRKC